MNMDELNAYLLSPVAQVALIMGIAELVKRIGLPKKFIPLVDVGLGLISGILCYGVLMKYGVISGGMMGLAMGLSACGLFSGVKNLVENTDTEGTEE